MNTVLAFEVSVRALLLWSCQAAVLVSMVWLILRLDRPHRPKERYKVWVTTLLIILLLPTTGRVATLLAEVRTTFEGQTPTLLMSGGALVATVTKPAKAAVERVGGVTATSLGLIWLLGAGWGLTSRVASYRRLQRIAVTAAPVCLSELSRIESDWRSAGGRVSPILQSDQVTSPMLFGYFRPVILLPADMEVWTTAEERTAILRHELMHVKRRDHAIQCLELVVSVIFFFHPLVRVARRELDHERELACDAAVLELGSDPHAYAEGILKVAERCIRTPRVLASVPFASRQDLGARIDMLFRNRSQNPSWSAARLLPFPMIASLLLAFVLAAPSTANRVESRDPRLLEIADNAGIPGGVAGGIPGGVAGGVPSIVREGVGTGIPTDTSAITSENTMRISTPYTGQPMRLVDQNLDHPMHLLGADTAEPMRRTSEPEHPTHTPISEENHP